MFSYLDVRSNVHTIVYCGVDTDMKRLQDIAPGDLASGMMNDETTAMILRKYLHNEEFQVVKQ